MTSSLPRALRPARYAHHPVDVTDARAALAFATQRLPAEPGVLALTTTGPRYARLHDGELLDDRSGDPVPLDHVYELRAWAAASSPAAELRWVNGVGASWLTVTPTPAPDTPALPDSAGEASEAGGAGGGEVTDCLTREQRYRGRHRSVHAVEVFTVEPRFGNLLLLDELIRAVELTPPGRTAP